MSDEFFNDTAKTDPVNLTGYTAQMTIGNGLLVLSSAGGGLTLGGAAGTVQVFAGHAQTAPIPLGMLPWFLAWTDPSGEPDCPASDEVTVTTP